MPSLNTGFEFNGLYWHSEDVLTTNNQSKTKDYEKLLKAKSISIRLIQIFEDEWHLKQQIVQSRIQNILGKTQQVIYARKCTVAEIDSASAAKFCNHNHIMGAGRSNVRYGLFQNGLLLSVMTFSKSNLSRKIDGWELNRFCTAIGHQVVGGASKLFSAFVRNANPTEIVSYSDNRWSDGKLYHNLGFGLTHSGAPNYWYISPNCAARIHRFTLRKNSNDDPLLTESILRKQQGYSRVWDSGSSRWQWRRPE